MTSKTGKIDFSSRYYEPFRILRAKVASQNVFRLVPNEEKGTLSLPYLYGDYKNELEPIFISNRIINSIKKYLDDNLFRLDEKKLLLSELMPYVTSFGEETINTLANRIKLTKNKEQYSKIISEYEKTITALKHINEIITNEFAAFYISLTAETYSQQPKVMPKNFEIELRETFDKQYFKVFLKPDADFESIAYHLTTLNSVRKANITDQTSGKRDITVYPAKAFDPAEVRLEIELTLTNYFNGSPVDPIFFKETISSLSDKAYFQILDYILLLGKNLEGFKELNIKFDEERYRDYFVPFLNSISQQHAAKGEVFNRQGKTDILVFDNKGNNIFIAECKLWKGEAYLLSAVQQLLENYVNWRDEKTSIIIFNRDVKKFSDVIDTAINAVSNHPLCSKFLGQRTETSYSFLFRNPDDESKTVKLELVLLNFR